VTDDKPASQVEPLSDLACYQFPEGYYAWPTGGAKAVAEIRSLRDQVRKLEEEAVAMRRVCEAVSKHFTAEYAGSNWQFRKDTRTAMEEWRQLAGKGE
jgi:hypothetical protein